MNTIMLMVSLMEVLFLIELKRELCLIHSPLVQIDGKSAGAGNAKRNAGGVFANQFALWAHHKYNAPIAPMSFFEKAADIIKKLSDPHYQPTHCFQRVRSNL